MPQETVHHYWVRFLLVINKVKDCREADAISLFCKHCMDKGILNVISRREIVHFADLAAIVASKMGGSKRVLWSCLGALAWAMWLTRNKIAIERIFPSHPANILYKCNILMQQWSPLAKHKDADKMKQAQDRLRQVYVLAREPPAASTT